MSGSVRRPAGSGKPGPYVHPDPGSNGGERQTGLDAGPVLADGVPSCGYAFDGLVCDEVGQHFCHPRAAYRLLLDAELAACSDRLVANRIWGAHLWADPEVRWSTTWAAYLPVRTEVGPIELPKLKKRPRSKPKPPPTSRTVEVDDGEAVTITITIERKRKS